jgi:hypothetical protein
LARFSRENRRSIDEKVALLRAAQHSVSIASCPASKPAGFLALIHPGPAPIIIVVTVAAKLAV